MHHFVAGIHAPHRTHTDYALRVLIALAALRREQRVTIQNLACRHRVSASHLMKVAVCSGS